MSGRCFIPAIIRRPVVLAASALALACLCAVSWGEATLETDVNRFSLTTDDLLHMTVQVNMDPSDSAEEPELEESSDFLVLGAPSRESGFSLINMKGSKYLRLTFTLQPLRTGDLTLPVATVVVDGQLLRSTPTTVSVQHGSGSAAQPSGPTPQSTAPGPGGVPFTGSPGFAVVLRVDPKSVYVNQQLSADVDYYTAYRLPHAPGQKAPVAEGFVAEALPDPEAEYVSVNSQQYVRATRRWALFPASAGAHTIQSSPEELMLPPHYQKESFQSNAVKVTVKPLPPAPSGSGFTGAVGRFTIQINADKQRVKAGEGLTVRAVVDGTGNVQSVQPPRLQVPGWCKVYQSGEKRTAEPRTAGAQVLLGGRAEFEYLVVPRRDGKLEIPGARLVYFDPDARAYKTAHSSGLSVLVDAGEVLEEEREDEGETALMHIHTGSPRLRAPRPLPATPFLPLVLALSALAPICAGVLQALRQRRLADPEGVRASAAARQARRSLLAAGKLTGAPAAEALSEIIHQYLADRFGLPSTGLTLHETAAALEARGVAERVIADVTRLLSACGDARFAPGASAAADTVEMLHEAREIIDALEGGMQS